MVSQVEKAEVFDPFGNENAKYLNPTDVARTFVPLSVFWDLFADGNHILLGTRGSGKTAVGKMLSHDHLKLLNHPKAQEIIKSKRFIGVYAPARLNWVSGVKSQLLGTKGPERDYFIFRINFILAESLLGTLRSCIDSYVKYELQADAEYSLVREILKLWTPNSTLIQQIYTLKDLSKKLATSDFLLQRVDTRNHYGAPAHTLTPFDQEIAQSFGTELAQPVIALWHVIRDAFDLPGSSKIIIAIDEMEFLTAEHHKILNGLLRAYDTGYIFKFITAPYCHYTLATETPAPLIEDQDFTYIHMDNSREVDFTNLKFEIKPADAKYSFHFALFLKRAEAAGIDIKPDDLHALLGPSDVLDPAAVNAATILDTIRKTMRHVNDETQDRINKKLQAYHRGGEKVKAEILRSISNELLRKLKPSVVIRDLVKEEVGATKGTAYSGLSMVMACTDGNPRILIRTFKLLFGDLRSKITRDTPIKTIEKRIQNEVMDVVSKRFFDSIWAVPEIGPSLSKFVEKLGDDFRRRLHVEQIGTDVAASVEIDETDPNLLNLVKQAVAWGYMYPHYKDERRPALPMTEGEFRLGYALAPKFKILPRRGRKIRLKSVLPQRQLEF